MKRLACLLCGAVWVAGCGGGADDQAKRKPEPKPILGRKTQKIVDLKKDRAKFKDAPVEARGSDGILNPGRAYAGTVSKTQRLMIRHAIDLFHATEGRYPKDYDEFMKRIVKPNRIKLPVLPGDRQYAYDSDTRELTIVQKR